MGSYLTSMSKLLIIPSYLGTQKHINILGTCIKSIRASTDASILIVDDGSPLEKDEKNLIYYEAIKEGFSNVKIHLKEENEGFSKTVNVGLNQALEQGDDAVLINADIEFREKGWLEELESSDADIIGGLLFYPNSLIQHAGIYFSIITRNFAHRFAGAPPNLPAAQEPCECPVTAALQYIRHPALADVGVYDEEFKMGFEDVDFMIRAIDKGHKSLYNPKVKAIHHESLFRSGQAKTDKIKEWEADSLSKLLTKYQEFEFDHIAPTMMRG